MGGVIPPCSLDFIEQIVGRFLLSSLTGVEDDDLNLTGTTFPLTQVHPEPILSVQGVYKGM